MLNHIKVFHLPPYEKNRNVQNMIFRVLSKLAKDDHFLYMETISIPETYQQQKPLQSPTGPQSPTFRYDRK